MDIYHRLLGYADDIELSDDYWDEYIISNLPGGQTEWDAMTPMQRGKRQAFTRVHNMQQFIERYEQIISSNKKRSEREMEKIKNEQRKQLGV